MCGRAYSTITEEELEMRYHWKRSKRNPLGLKSNYNISPTHEVPIVRLNKGEVQIDLLRWGLVPFWAKDVKVGYKMINARAETIAEKPSFKNAFKKRRCIVPLSGFIEWKRDGDSKRPFAIYLKDHRIMSVAGIWESWRPEDGKKELETFSIITTDSNSFMNKIHDRMPVILNEADEQEWLDVEGDEDFSALTRLLVPCPSKILAAHEISTLINSPKNNREELLDPI